MPFDPTHHPLKFALPLLLLATACQQAPPPNLSAQADVAPQKKAEIHATADLLLRPSQGFQQASAQSALLTDLVAVQKAAAEQNLALLAARLKAEAAHSAIDAAGGYPDPTFKIGGFVQPLETRNGPTQAKLSLQQPLPWRQGLDAQVDVARAGARQAEAGLAALQRKVRRQCAELWWELAYLHQADQIIQQNLELLDSTHAVVSSRLEVGRARLPELLRVEMEAVQLRDRRRQFQDRQTPLRTRLNSLLGFSSSDAKWQKPTLPAGDWLQNLALLDASKQSFDASQHPELAALAAAAQGQLASWRMKQSAERPQLGIGLDWTLVGDGNAMSPDSGEDAIALMLSVKVPLHRGRDQARTAQAHAHWQMAEQAQRDREVQLLSEWQQARFELDNALATAQLLEQELSTRVESALQTELAAFESGDEAFEGLLASLRLLLDFQLRHIEAQKQVMQSLAKLDELAGVQLLEEVE